MANINDFKLLNEKCIRYFDLLEKEAGQTIPVPSDNHKARFGFYLFMIESICQTKDIWEILDYIADQEFNSVVWNQKEEDYGIDAIVIDYQITLLESALNQYRPADRINITQKLTDVRFKEEIDKTIING